VSTARKRTAAEAERVRQVNLLARLWQSAAMADALWHGWTAVDGSFAVWTGPVKDNTGKVVIPKGKVFKQTDMELESMNYLIEGVIGKA